MLLWLFFWCAAFAGDARTIYVDPLAGADTNSGSAAQPLKTVAEAVHAALNNRRQGSPTTITLRPGLYREAIHLDGQGPADAPEIVLRADQAGSAIITGSDRWEDWQKEEIPTPGRYSHTWPYKWGSCSVPAGWPRIQPLGLRREMIFVNDQLLTQVLSAREMRTATFYVDETGGRVYVWPPEGVDLNAAQVEVGVRPVLLESNGNSNLTLSGLVLEHATSCISTQPVAAVMVSGGSKVLIEDSAFRWNNWIGLDLFSLTGSVMRRTTANHNGENGINAFRLRHAVFEDVEASHNNWRGGLGKFVIWEPSGAKLLRIHGASLERFTAVGNQGRGLWFDTDNSDIEIQHAYLAENQTGGIDLEASSGPITIANSRICSNGREGIQGSQAESVKLIDNIIYNNERAQIWMAVTAKPRTDTNWETKEKFSVLARNWTIMGNTIEGTHATQLLYQGFLFMDPASGPFLSTLTIAIPGITPQTQSRFSWTRGRSKSVRQRM